MKHFLLVINAQEGFLAKGVTDREVYMLDTLLKSNCFDCVISSVHQNRPDSSIMGFTLTQAEQKLTDTVAAHTHHLIYKSTYSAYSEALVSLLKAENGGVLPECVYLAGFDLDRCVLMTAVDLLENGIRPMVLTQYCGTSGGDAARFASIRTLQSLIGANHIHNEAIRTPAELDQLLDSAKNSARIPCVASQEKAQLLVDRLQALGWHIAFAESCTGGKAAAGIVDIPSASSVFDASFVTYANDAKIRLVGVCPDTIRQHGVVSEPVAAQMAIGAATAAGAQVGVGISGIAGPGGGTAATPVGTVCFGFYIDGQTHTKTMQFGSIGRSAVRQACVDFVYDTLLQFLASDPKEA